MLLLSLKMVSGKKAKNTSEDYTETLIFNEQGKLVEACYGEEYHFLFTYDSHGNRLSSRLYDPEDEALTDCWEEKQYIMIYISK